MKQGIGLFCRIFRLTEDKVSCIKAWRIFAQMIAAKMLINP
jgi:hypothetical protein